MVAMIPFSDPQVFAVPRMVCLIQSNLAHAGSPKMNESRRSQRCPPVRARCLARDRGVGATEVAPVGEPDLEGDAGEGATRLCEQLLRVLGLFANDLLMDESPMLCLKARLKCPTDSLAMRARASPWTLSVIEVVREGRVEASGDPGEQARPLG